MKALWRRRRSGVLLAVVLAVLLGWLWPLPAYAAPTQDGKVVFGGSYVLPPGETLSGDLVVLGGSALISQESRVMGNLTVFGGSAVVAGEVTGDVVALGGEVALRPSALVAGDVVITGGRLRWAPGAQVHGRVIEQGVFRAPLGHWGLAPLFPWGKAAAGGSGHDWAWWLLWLPLRVGLALLRALVFALLAVLLMALAPTTTRKTSRTLLTRPWESGGLGVLLALLTPVVAVVLVLTVVGIPLALVLLAAVGLVALYGWLALGVALGERLAEAFHAAWNPLVSAAVGTTLLYLVVAGADLIPCVGWLVGLFTFIVGLGGATLALFDVLPPEVREKMSHTITVQARPASEGEETPPAE